MVKCNEFGGRLSFLEEHRDTQEHWGNLKLIDASKNTLFTETKKNFNACNVKSKKILHQRSSGLAHLTKKDSKSNDQSCHIVYDAIRAVSQHATDKAFDAYNSWYQFPCYMLINGYPSLLAYFLGRENTEIPDNMHLDVEVQADFIIYVGRWHKEFASEGSDGMEISRHFLFVVIPYIIMILFQDAHWWLREHPEHYFSHYLKVRIQNMRNVEKREKLKEYIANCSKIVDKIEKGHEKMLAESTIREARINQHVSNLFREQYSKLNDISNSIYDGNKEVVGVVNKCNDHLFEIKGHVLDIKEMMFDRKYRGARQSREDNNSKGDELSHWEYMDIWNRTRREETNKLAVIDNPLHAENRVATSAHNSKKRGNSKSGENVNRVLNPCKVKMFATKPLVNNCLELPVQTCENWFNNKLHKFCDPVTRRGWEKNVNDHWIDKKNYMRAIFLRASLSNSEMKDAVMQFNEHDLKWKFHLSEMAIRMEAEMKQLKLRKDRTKRGYFAKQILFLKAVQDVKDGKSNHDIRVLLQKLTGDDLSTSEESRTSDNGKKRPHLRVNEKLCCECKWHGSTNNCYMCKKKYVCSECACKKFNVKNPAKYICSNCHDKSNNRSQYNKIDARMTVNNSSVGKECAARSNNISPYDNINTKTTGNNSCLGQETAARSDNQIHNHVGNKTFCNECNIIPSVHKCCLCKLKYVCGQCAFDKFGIENPAKHICSSCNGKSTNRKQDIVENRENKPKNSIVEISTPERKNESISGKLSQSSAKRLLFSNSSSNAIFSTPLTQDSEATEGNNNGLGNLSLELSPMSIVTFDVANSSSQYTNTNTWLSNTLSQSQTCNTSISRLEKNDEFQKNINCNYQNSIKEYVVEGACNNVDKVVNYVTNTKNMNLSTILDSQNSLPCVSQTSTSINSSTNAVSLVEVNEEEENTDHLRHEIQRRLEEIYGEKDNVLFITKYYKSKFYLVEHKCWDVNLSGLARTNLLKNFYKPVLGKKRYFESQVIDVMSVNNYASLSLKERMNKIVEVIKEGNSCRSAGTMFSKKYFTSKIDIFKQKYGTNLEENNDEFKGNITNITGEDEDNWEKFIYRTDLVRRKRKQRNDVGKVRTKRLNVAQTPDWRKGK